MHALKEFSFKLSLSENGKNYFVCFCIQLLHKRFRPFLFLIHSFVVQDNTHQIKLNINLHFTILSTSNHRSISIDFGAEVLNQDSIKDAPGVLDDVEKIYY